MLIETKRLIIRDLQTEDEIPFAEMAADGSLNDIGFDEDCGSWMAEWVSEAKELTLRGKLSGLYGNFKGFRHCGWFCWVLLL